MSNPADIFVCVIFFVLQGRLDGFPISRLSSDRDASLWSMAQPSASSSDSLWTFPETRLQQSSDKHDRMIPSTPRPSSPAAAVTCCRHGRPIIRSNDRSLTPTPADRRPSSPHSSSDKSGTRREVVTRSRPTDSDDVVISSTPPSDQEDAGKDVSSSYSPPPQQPSSAADYVAASSSRATARTYARVSWPTHEKKSERTTSYAMRLQSNFRLARQQEAPVIVFDQNGKMYTNVYPPPGHRSNDSSNRKTGDGRRYLPKWLQMIGGKKT